jgi:hypothetical protein
MTRTAMGLNIKYPSEEDERSCFTSLRFDNSSSSPTKPSSSTPYPIPRPFAVADHTFFPPSLVNAETLADAVGMCVHEKYLAVCADQLHADGHPPCVFYAGVVLAMPNATDSSLPPILQVHADLEISSSSYYFCSVSH